MQTPSRAIAAAAALLAFAPIAAGAVTFPSGPGPFTLAPGPFSFPVPTEVEEGPFLFEVEVRTERTLPGFASANVFDEEAMGITFPFFRIAGAGETFFPTEIGDPGGFVYSAFIEELLFEAGEIYTISLGWTQAAASRDVSGGVLMTVIPVPAAGLLLLGGLGGLALLARRHDRPSAPSGCMTTGRPSPRARACGAPPQGN